MAVRGADYERIARDAYMTPREPIIALLKVEQFRIQHIHDPCRGNGGLVRVLKECGYAAIGSDIDPWINSGQYPQSDFLKDDYLYKGTDILTNPPFGIQGKIGVAFVERALAVTRTWHGKVAMLLPIDFDSGKTRVHIFRDHPAWYRKVVLLDRIKWFNGQSGSTNFAWYVWNWAYDPIHKQSLATITYV